MVEQSLLQSTTALVLAGGRGSRMGGVDKGLQPWAGMPLVQHTLVRLQNQHGGPFGAICINANRNLAAYGAIASPYAASIVPDTIPDFAGPLAGLLAGIEQCRTPYLFTVPCDSPCFPLDLAIRLMRSLQASTLTAVPSYIAIAASAELEWQPVFCLVHVNQYEALQQYLQQGGRSWYGWAQRQCAQVVLFNQAGDDAQAFANINTFEQLHALQQT